MPVLGGIGLNAVAAVVAGAVVGAVRGAPVPGKPELEMSNVASRLGNLCGEGNRRCV